MRKTTKNSPKKKEKKKIEYFTMSTLLTRGWTKNIITELLGEPKLVDNPFYKCAAPMRLYEQKKVFLKEKTKKFITTKQVKEKHSVVGKKAADTKRKKLIETVKQFTFTVPRIDINKLKKQTLQAKQDWYNCISSWKNNYEPNDAYDADKLTVERWMVNYIRHELSDYEEKLDLLFGQTGKREAYELTRDMLFAEITITYPELAEECKRQNIITTTENINTTLNMPQSTITAEVKAHTDGCDSQ